MMNLLWQGLDEIKKNYNQQMTQVFIPLSLYRLSHIS
jgi:hypothetical protein